MVVLLDRPFPKCIAGSTWIHRRQARVQDNPISQFPTQVRRGVPLVRAIRPPLFGCRTITQPADKVFAV